MGGQESRSKNRMKKRESVDIPNGTSKDKAFFKAEVVKK